MFNWILIIFLTTATQTERMEFSVHQSLDSCVEAANEMSQAMKNTMEQELLEHVKLGCVHKSERVKI